MDYVFGIFKTNLSTFVWTDNHLGAARSVDMSICHIRLPISSLLPEYMEPFPRRHATRRSLVRWSAWWRARGISLLKLFSVIW